MKFTSLLCPLLLQFSSKSTSVDASAEVAAKSVSPEEKIDVYYVDADGEATIGMNSERSESIEETEDPNDEAVDEMEKWFQETKGGRNHALSDHMVDSVWGLHKRWYSTAKKRRKRISFYQILAISLISSGAVLQTLSHQLAPPYEWISSLVAGACLGIAPFITQQFLSHERITGWAASRATAEALKAEVFKFRAGIKPYDKDNSVEILALTATHILEPTAEFDTFDKLNINTVLWSPDEEDPKDTHSSRKNKLSKEPQYTYFETCRDFKMTTAKNAPPDLKLKKESYIEWRLKPQVECYFRKRARNLRNLIIIVKTIQNTLAGASSGIAFIAARTRFLTSSDAEGPTSWLQTKLSNIGIWGAVMTTIAAAIGTQFATSKLDEIAAEFRDAANEIERKVLIMASKNVDIRTKEWEDFVIECEEIIADTYKALKMLGGQKTRTKLSTELKDGESIIKKWDPSADCSDEKRGSYSAAERAEWLVKKKQYTVEAAQERVMEEFPGAFKV